MRTVLTSVVILAVLAGCSSQERREAEERRLRSAEYNTQLGITYFQEGNLEAAHGKLLKAVEQNEDYSVAHNALGVLYEKLGKNDQAEKHLKRAVRLDPRDSDAHNNYAQFLCRRGRIEDAEREFLFAVEDPLYAQRALAMTNFGMCLYQAKELQRAEDWLRQALQADPKFAPALFQMAQIAFETDRALIARAYMQRYEQVARQHSPASLWLGIRIEKALNGLDRAASLGLLLRGQFPTAEETRLYLQSEKK